MLRVFLRYSVTLLSLAGCGGSNGAYALAGDECGLSSGQTGLKICSFVATPTAAESITLKNYDSTPIDLSNYTLRDANALANGSGQKSLSGTLAGGSSQTFGSLPFQVNDSGETITLKYLNSVVHQRGN